MKSKFSISNLVIFNLIPIYMYSSLSIIKNSIYDNVTETYCILDHLINIMIREREIKRRIEKLFPLFSDITLL